MEPAVALKPMWGVWPYVLNEDGPSIPAGLLYKVWDELSATGRLQTLFYDGGITDFRQWVEFLSEAGRFPSLVLDNETMQPVFLGWIQDLKGGTATVHFAALGPYSRGAARTLLAFWDSWDAAAGGPLVHVYLGLTPETHRDAVRVAHTLGFKTLGTIPAACPLAWGTRVGGVVTYRGNPRR